jgi:hypothetical protein
MTDENKDNFEFLKLLAQDMRHTAIVIWQLSIAIVTLQGSALSGGVLILNAQNGRHPALGWFVLFIGFFLSMGFSFMLVRQARERGGFIQRAYAVEEALRKTYPEFLKKIDHTFSWFKSECFAWIIFGESVLGFIIIFVLFFVSPSAKDSTPTANAITIQIAPGQAITYPLESNKNVRIEVEAGKFKFSTTN